MLYGLILVVHVLACFFLVAVILLQAGRGGGLAEAFGGAAQSVLGTRGAAYLTRATTVFAVVFMLTSLTLAILSAQRGRSLMEAAATRAAAVKPPAAEEKTGTPATTEAPAPATPTPAPADKPATEPQ